MATPRPIGHIGRKRRWAGWTLLALGVLTAGAWIESGWWYCRLERGAWGMYCIDGTAIVSRDLTRAPFDLSNLLHRSFELQWAATDARNLYQDHAYTWFYFYGAKYPPASDYRVFQIVLWPIPLFLWAPAGVLLRSGIIARRRAMAGACAKCGYSLAGLAFDAPCPECGKAKAG